MEADEEADEGVGVAVAGGGGVALAAARVAEEAEGIAFLDLADMATASALLDATAGLCTLTE